MAELAERRAIHVQRVSRTGLMRTALLPSPTGKRAYRTAGPVLRTFEQSFPMLDLLVVRLLLCARCGHGTQPRVDHPVRAAAAATRVVVGSCP